MGQPVDPNQNSSTARAISESVDPTPEFSRSLNAHDETVAYRLHKVKPSKQPFNGPNVRVERATGNPIQATRARK